MAELARILTGVGADVRIIDIPAADDGCKQGIDDFLVAAGRDDIRRARSTRPRRPDEFAAESCAAGPQPVRPARTRRRVSGVPGPGRVARPAPVLAGRVLAVHRHPLPGSPGRRGQGPAGRLGASTELDRRLADMAACGQRTRSRSTCRLDSSPTSGKPCPAGACCPRRSRCRRGSTGPAGRLRGTSSRWSNGLLDVAAGDVAPAHPGLLRADGRAVCLRPDRADLRKRGSGSSTRSRPTDPDAVATLQEWLGYLLTAGTSQQKILFLVGPMRSGKGNDLPGTRGPRADRSSV